MKTEIVGVTMTPAEYGRFTYALDRFRSPVVALMAWSLHRVEARPNGRLHVTRLAPEPKVLQ